MGIKVKHDMSGSLFGDMAAEAGFNQGMQKKREQNRSQANKEMQLAIQAAAQRDANQRFYAQLAQRAKENKLALERTQELGHIQNQLAAEREEYEYSTTQKREKQRLAEAKDYIMRNPENSFTADEQKLLLRQIAQREAGLVPNQRINRPWAKEHDVGQVWVDQGTGATMTRDDRGNVKVLVQPENISSIDNQLKLKKQIADLTTNLMKPAGEFGDTISFEAASKMANEFYSDMMPNQIPAAPIQEPMPQQKSAARKPQPQEISKPPKLDARASQLMEIAVKKPQDLINWSMQAHGRETALELEIILKSEDENAIYKALKKLGAL